MQPLSPWKAFLLLTSAAASRSGHRRPPQDPNQGSTTIVSYNTIIEQCTVPGVIAITYDDGPGPYTDELLEILDTNQVKATFFVNGNNNVGPITEGNLPDVLQRTYAAGHHIGSHTWSHPNLDSLSHTERTEQMEALRDALSGIIGYEPTYMRPPFFACGTQCLEDMASLEYRVVNANLDPKDYLLDYAASRSMYSSALASGSLSDPGFIVLVHDIHVDTVRSFTQYMIDEARLHGYRLVTLGECLDDPEYNWYRAAGTLGKKPGLNMPGNATRSSG